MFLLILNIEQLYYVLWAQYQNVYTNSCPLEIQNFSVRNVDRSCCLCEVCVYSLKFSTELEKKLLDYLYKQEAHGP